MIRLIRIDGMEVLLNPDLVHTLKDHPELGTLIRFQDGEVVHVKNSQADITTKIRASVQGKRDEQPPDPQKSSSRRFS